MWANPNEEEEMSDERDRFAENEELETEDTDVEAHRHDVGRHDVGRHDVGRHDVGRNDAGNTEDEIGDEPDVEAHRWASGTGRHDAGV